MEKEKGRWITVKGTHVFIKDGQTVGEAIQEMKRHALTEQESFAIMEGRNSALTDSQGFYRTNTPYEALINVDLQFFGPKRQNSSGLTKKEWAEWYRAIGEIKRGMYVISDNGQKLIQIGRKIVFTEGTYEDPIAVRVVSFNTVRAADNFLEDIYYGKTVNQRKD